MPALEGVHATRAREHVRVRGQSSQIRGCGARARGGARRSGFVFVFVRASDEEDALSASGEVRARGVDDGVGSEEVSASRGDSLGRAEFALDGETRTRGRCRGMREPTLGCVGVAVAVEVAVAHAVSREGPARASLGEGDVRELARHAADARLPAHVELAERRAVGGGGRVGLGARGVMHRAEARRRGVDRAGGVDVVTGETRARFRHRDELKTGTRGGARRCARADGTQMD